MIEETRMPALVNCPCRGWGVGAGKECRSLLEEVTLVIRKLLTGITFAFKAGLWVRAQRKGGNGEAKLFFHSAS